MTEVAPPGLTEAVVVGSGPNGLAAAVELARRGYPVHVVEGAATVGGGTRTLELIEPGHWHDVCSAAHPLGIASPFFNSLPLSRFGLEWVKPEIQVSHPLGGGRAVGLAATIAETSEILGGDGSAYERLIGPIVSNLDEVVAGTLAPLQSTWRRPAAMGRFGIQAIRSTKSLADRFGTEAGRALLAGLGAHAIAPLDAPSTGGVALVLAATAHRSGWPIARRGSQAIADALCGYLLELGGTVETGRWVESISELAPQTAVFLDTSPMAAVGIAGSRITPALANRMAKWRHGPGSHKVDWILSNPIPWRDELSPRSATVHVGGSFEEIAASEERVIKGTAPDNPFVLVTQPSLFDQSRAPAGRFIGWGYCHVPAGYTGDATAAIEDQVERFAPGFKDSVIARHVHTAAALERYNPNYVGGDIAGGALTLRQLILRPRLARNPYRICRGTYLCSASAAPGAGVHGMGGYNAVAYSSGDFV